MMNPQAPYKSFVGVVMVIASAILLPQGVSAQTAARPDRGLVPGASYSVSDTEAISLTNGNLNLSIPLASLPPIAGGKLNFSLSAIYNSKLWNITRVQHQLPPISNCGSWVTDTPQIGDAGGWRIGGGYQIAIRDARDDFNYHIPNPPPPEDPCFGNLQDQVLLQNRYYRVVLIGPDGAEHELRPIDHTNTAYSGYGSSFLFNHYTATPDTVGGSMRYYSVDGSYLWAVINPSSNPIRWTAYLNDGTKVTQYSDGIQRISDTNGNSIKIFSDAAGGHIQDEQTGREIRLTYDPSANNGWGQTQIIYPTVTGIQQTIAINYGTTRVEGIVYPVQDWSESGGETGGGMVCQKHNVLFSDLYVIRSIVFPATEPGVASRRFEFNYSSDQKETVSHEVWWACMQPSQTYTRQVSKGLGALSEMITPTGAVVKYGYSRDQNYIYLFNADDIPRETVRQKSVTHDGTTETWNYDIAEFNACGGTVTGPDGSVTTENCEPRDSGFGNYSTSNPKGGLVFRTNSSNKVRVERHWTLLKFDGANGGATGNYGEIPFNPVVDAEYTTLLEGNPAQAVKMSAKTFQYDFNGNLISQTEYDWFDPTGIPRDAVGVPTGVPAGATVLRVTNNAYYNDSTSPYSANVYAKRAWGATPLILNAAQQSSVGPAITQLSYDGQPYGSPPTAGNLTRKSVWNSVASDWIVTENTYGLYGNLSTSTDGRGKVTTFGYDNPALGLPNYVTVDPQNGTGTQTTTTAFDYSTGLVTSTTDPNGNTSNIDYTNQLLGTIDPFGRPGIAFGPLVNAGGSNQRHRTRTFYADSSRTVTTLSDFNAEGDGLLKKQVISDQLGRVIESRQYENANDFITVRNSYDIPNRLSRTSSPFRAGESVVWTTTVSDLLGRAVSITTPDNAVISTSYFANTVTVTDQDGKQRKSVTDAGGRLAQVYEDPNGLNYLTSYNYDSLDNLIAIYQGSQARSFAYDSLKRLTSATNPESGTVSYQYDNNGNLLVKTDPRGVSSHYEYDALNRVTRRWYNGSSAPTAATHNSPALPSGVGTSDEAKYFYDSQSIPGAPTFDRGFAIGKIVAKTYGGGSAGDYYGFDSLGRAKLKIQQTGGVNYQTSATYNLAGAVATITYPSGRSITNTFDSAGRLTSFAGNLGDGTQRTYSTGIVYSAFGGRAKEKFGTGTPLFNKSFYNSRGQLAEIRVGTTYTGPNDTGWQRGAIINHYSYQCWGMCGGSNSTTSMTDNNANLKKQDVYIPDNDPMTSYTTRWQQYEYDSLNRLQWVREISGESEIWRQSYLYDRYGNRTIDQASTWGAGIPKPNFGVDTSTNRLIAPAGYSMGYDQIGNQTNDTYTGQGARTYDAENRMTGAQASSPASYAYDGDGRRVKRMIGTTETWQVYGIAGELIAEYAANAAPSNPQNEYGYRSGELLITATVTTGSGGSAFAFTDDPVVAETTNVRAVHLTELRTAVNQARARANLSSATWADDPVQATVTAIKAVHITELRARLDEARAALGLSAANYTDSTLVSGYQIKAAHVQELRTKTNEALTIGAGTSLDLRWMVADHLGTPRMVFDQTGSLANVSRHDYLPFGEELFAGTGGRTTAQGYTASDNVRQKFTKYERDAETGLDYAQARMFAYSQGRFTSPDPYKIVAEVQNETDPDRASSMLNAYLVQPQQWNQYTYAINNPLKYIDPTGETIVLTGTPEEQQAALERIKGILGADRFALVTQSTVNGNIHLTLEASKVQKFAAMGNNDDEKTLSVGMAQILNRSSVVEFRVAEQFQYKDARGKTRTGYTGKGCIISACAYGGLTLRPHENASGNGNYQIFVHPNAGKIATSSMPLFADVTGGKGSLVFSNDMLDAHEFGHVWEHWQGPSLRDNNPRTKKYYKPDSVNFENAVRSRYPSPIRRTRH
jgi:RHS repeat-associated protein